MMRQTRSRSPIERRRDRSANEESEEEENTRVLRPRAQANPSSPTNSRNLRMRQSRSYADCEMRQSSSIPRINYDEWVEKLSAQQDNAIDELDARYFTFESACNSGLKKPLLFTNQLDELKMTIPKFSYRQVLSHLRNDQKALVYNHLTEEEKMMRISTVVREIEKPIGERNGQYSFSFKCSASNLGNFFEAPFVFRQLDWSYNVFPREKFASRRYDYTDKYLVMTMAGSFSDFHIEFSGTTTWQHVQSGHQFYFLVRPSTENIEALEKYHEVDNSDLFFAEFVKNCKVVRVNATQTLMIPAGYIYAVYSPVDCLIYTGNFLHEHSLEIQLKIYDRDQSTATEKFVYPFYEQNLWYFLADFVKRATKLNFVGLIHSDRYEEWQRRKSLDKKFAKYECFDLSENDCYDKKGGKPIQQDFDPIDDVESKAPIVTQFNNEFLKHVRPEIRVTIKKFTYEALFTKGVAEGIRRPKHLFAVLKQIVEMFKKIPYEVRPIKKHENHTLNGNFIGNESPANLPNLDSTNEVPGPSNSSPKDSSQEMEVEPEGNETFAQKLKAMCEEGHFDCIFSSNGQEFKIFKNVLMCQSNYFKQHLTLNDGLVTEVKMDEFDALSVKAFVDWIFFGEVKNFNRYVNDLFELASRYEIHKLKLECLSKMMLDLNEKNLCTLLIHAFTHNDDELKRQLVEYAKSNGLARQIMKTPEWKEFARDNDEMSNLIIDLFLS